MHIEFVRTGGISGMRLARSFDTQKLLPDQASALTRLIDEVGFFKLPEQIKQSSSGVDRYQYQISVSSAQQAHTINIDEAAITEQLHPLIDLLTSLALTINKL
jgi:hypothetical protein